VNQKKIQIFEPPPPKPESFVAAAAERQKKIQIFEPPPPKPESFVAAATERQKFEIFEPPPIKASAYTSKRNKCGLPVAKKKVMVETASRDWRPGGAQTSDYTFYFDVSRKLHFRDDASEIWINFRRNCMEICGHNAFLLEYEFLGEKRRFLG
jgi:hypothetical protein